MSAFEALPNEVLMHILHFLNAKDITNAALTCRRLSDVTQIDSLWQHLCHRDYGLSFIDENIFESHRQVYTKDLHHCFPKYELWCPRAPQLTPEGTAEGKQNCTNINIIVLYPYGYCLGVWILQKNHYGMVINTQLQAGEIIGYNCLAPSSGDVRDPLRKIQRYCVTVKNGEAIVLCKRGCTAKLKRIDTDKMVFLCDNCAKKKSEAINFQNEEFREWIQEAKDGNEFDWRPFIYFMYPDGGFGGDLGRLIFRYSSLQQATQNWSFFELQRVELAQKSLSIVPLKLGIYKGTYGPHGLELLHLEMADDGYTLLGHKLTGDPNVPAGETSLFIDLRRPMVLTQEDQQTLNSLESVDPPTLSTVRCLQPEDLQPFTLSMDTHINIRGDQYKLPNSCRGRFCAQGRIAGHNYTNPGFCKAHFIIFEENFFGFLWLDLHSFSVFSHVTDELH